MAVLIAFSDIVLHCLFNTPGLSFGIWMRPRPCFCVVVVDRTDEAVEFERASEVPKGEVPIELVAGV